MERVAVLASGSGTILESIQKAGIELSLVAADRPCRALGIVEGKSSPTQSLLIDRNTWGGFGARFDRLGYTKALTEVLCSHEIGLVVMAGFGTILDDPIHRAYPARILNTHPSLLPSFPGWHAVKDALDAGVVTTGCTVHLATVEMDAGPILAQIEVQVLATDTVATLHERIKEAERVLYPKTISEAIECLNDGGTLGVLAQSRADSRAVA